MKDKNGVVTVGSLRKVNINNNNWYFTSTKISSNNKAVATGMAKNNPYILEVKGKAEGSATLTIKIKAYRYVG